jgi:Zn-dependent protease
LCCRFDTAWGEPLGYEPFRHRTREPSDRDSLTLGLQDLLLVVPVLLFSVIAHEYAHGYAALKQGDTTALSLGRLTWNPVKHIDLWMTILMPLLLWKASGGSVVFGGAKPVPVDPRKYRNYRRGDIIVSLAGVVTNLLIAIACVPLIALVAQLGRAEPLERSAGFVQAMLVRAVPINLTLLVFNLLPIPPLDGSHVVKHLLPPAWALHYQRIGFYGIAVLVLLLWVVPQALSFWLRPAWLAADAMLGLVDTTLLPSARAWLR